MRVILSADLFIPPVEETHLISVFAHALDRRHRVEADLDSQIVSDWLRRQSPQLQEEILHAVEASLQFETLEPASAVVEVSRDIQTDWHSQPPKVQLRDLRPLLEVPFSIMLEDSETDKHFLLKMLTSQEKRLILDYEARGFIQFDHGGGLSKMRQQVISLQGESGSKYRNWLLFDSDALRPGCPSAQSEALRNACGDIPHYQLKRRFIENYIPGKALNAWASAGRNRDERKARFKRVDAFLGMNSDQRHHFNVKNGFSGDASRNGESAGDLYDTLGEEDRRILWEGIDGGIGKIFGQEAVAEADLISDLGWNELRPVITMLLASLR